jgi:MraZ protein
LAELAGLQRDVVLLGVHDHAEIWDAKLWDEFLTRLSPEFDAMATQVFESQPAAPSGSTE